MLASLDGCHLKVRKWELVAFIQKDFMILLFV
jgi:hypothetical protein